MTVSLKRTIDIWTLGVEEKPGLALCPEHLIANGVRVRPLSKYLSQTLLARYSKRSLGKKEDSPDLSYMGCTLLALVRVEGERT